MLGREGYPLPLKNLPQPPAAIYTLGTPLEQILNGPALAVVGSRKLSNYGRAVTEKLAAELAGLGVTIISGLALGVDGIAHQAALEAGGKTIAVLPCGLDQIYPRSHQYLARQIVQKGGALVSEYAEGTAPQKHSFIARNRIIAALSQGVVITEAAEKSGSLHTARFALEQGLPVLAVPGNITSYLSAGTNNLIKFGAIPVTSIEDVLSALNIQIKANVEDSVIASSPEEAAILEALKEGSTETADILARSRLDSIIFNQTMTMLEIHGKVKAVAGHWHLS